MSKENSIKERKFEVMAYGLREDGSPFSENNEFVVVSQDYKISSELKHQSVASGIQPGSTSIVLPVGGEK